MIHWLQLFGLRIEFCVHARSLQSKNTEENEDEEKKAKYGMRIRRDEQNNAEMRRERGRETQRHTHPHTREIFHKI